MKVIVDGAVCQGHGNCYARYPELFTPDEEGFAVVLLADLDEDQRDDALCAAAGCPERAIAVAEGDLDEMDAHPGSLLGGGRGR